MQNGSALDLCCALPPLRGTYASLYVSCFSQIDSASVAFRSAFVVLPPILYLARCPPPIVFMMRKQTYYISSLLSTLKRSRARFHRWSVSARRRAKKSRSGGMRRNGGFLRDGRDLAEIARSALLPVAFVTFGYEPKLPFRKNGPHLYFTATGACELLSRRSRA